MTTDHRVTAFCDWLCSLPQGQKFHEQPGFAFFRDLTEDQLDAAQTEMRRRAAAAFAEANALKAPRATTVMDEQLHSDRIGAIHSGRVSLDTIRLASEIGTPDEWLEAAISHLKAKTSGPTRSVGATTVSIAAIDLVLIKLEELLHGGRPLAEVLAEAPEA